MLDRVNEDAQLAVVRYFANDVQILRPGHFVRCAVTGQKLALENLRYWNVDLQEAYACAEVAIGRWKALRDGAK